jgi:hypothetical protein
MVILMGLMSGCARKTAATGPQFQLDYSRLDTALGPLSNEERKAVSDTMELIKSGKHSLALVRLFELNERNPANSSLRILASYALLQGGNLIGAFEEAEKAHKAADGNSYKCWFMAKVALLNGKPEVCARELGHVKGVGDMPVEAAQLEKEMRGN